MLTLLAATTVGSASCEVSPVAAVNYEKLSGPQIGAKFAGMQQLTDEVHYRRHAAKLFNGDKEGRHALTNGHPVNELRAGLTWLSTAEETGQKRQQT